MKENILSISDLHMKYGDFEVLKGINLDVMAGEKIIIMGSSGGGKSTLLRAINHLEKTSSGKMVFDGRTIDLAHWKKDDINFVRNNTTMVFQNYNLFSHKTALENVTEGLIQVKKINRKEAEEIGQHYLDKTGMLPWKDSYPSTLSGGQQQRVGIARSLALSPKIIMFDEPTAALDPELVGEVLNIMTQVAEEGITMLIVTHQISFAREVADKVAFLHKGVITEFGTPDKVLFNPESQEMKQFLRLIDL